MSPSLIRIVIHIYSLCVVLCPLYITIMLRLSSQLIYILFCNRIVTRGPRKPNILHPLCVDNVIMGREYENRNIIESITDISCDLVASITMRLQTFPVALIFQSNNIGDYTYVFGGSRIVPPQEI